MKKIHLIILLITGLSYAQNVAITDNEFKYMLLISNSSNGIAYSNGLSHKIDSNDDGEIQVSEAIVIDSLDVNQGNALNNITSLSGINDFINLKKLDCGVNPITTIDFLDLPSLKKLYCSRIDITSLNLTLLPNLEELKCDNGQLTTINLSNLPQLKRLTCNFNAITALDLSAVTSLINLECNYNNLTSLNLSNLLNITTLQCCGNAISSVDFSGNPNLATVFCFDNIISSLNLSSNPNLTYLDCTRNNMNSLILNGSSSFFHLDCSDNQLTSLDFTGLTGLWILKCSNNPLTTLDVSMLTSLLVFECNNSQLTTLDFSNNLNLTQMSCFANQLQTLFIKNGRNEIFNAANWIENPTLEFICADESQLADLQSAIDLGINVSSYCTFTPGGNYNTISGTVTFDANNNGCDANDIFQPNIRVNIDDSITQGATFTNNTGNYSFFTQVGSFSISPSVENPTWFNFSPSAATIPFANNNNNTVTQNFCISANGVHPDVEIVIAPIFRSRPGFDAVYQVVYKNKGNQTLSGNVNFTYDDAVLDFVSATVAPNLQSLGTLSWNYTNLLPFENRSIYITLNVNAPTETPAVNIGDLLNFAATVNPIAGDENPSDNTFSYNEIVVGSYDPNYVTCIEGTVVSPSEIGNYLHYVINFENTGTANAENIVVRDVIDVNQFDVTSLQLLNSSAPVTARLTGNVAEFIFQNIQLQSGGHGNILLKIKSKNTLVQGDTVRKKANIYFDYNFPIETNNADTIFQALNSPDFQNDASISVYPNPTNGIITINCNNNIKSVELYDVQGRLLQTNLVAEQITTLDISEKAKGVYFLKVTSEKGVKVEKLVKE